MMRDIEADGDAFMNTYVTICATLKLLVPFTMGILCGHSLVARYKGCINSNYLPDGEGCLQMRAGVGGSATKFTGVFVDGCLDGHCTVESDQNIFLGEFLRGRMCGLGEAEWDCFIFTGEYKDGVPEGFCVLQNMHTGDTRLGTWKGSKLVKELVTLPSFLKEDGAPLLRVQSPTRKGEDEKGADYKGAWDTPADQFLTEYHQPAWDIPAANALEGFRKPVCCDSHGIAVAQPDLLGLVALERRMPKQITVPLDILSALVRGINRATS